jgi:hypothetical protein
MKFMFVKRSINSKINKITNEIKSAILVKPAEKISSHNKSVSVTSLMASSRNIQL